VTDHHVAILEVTDDEVIMGDPLEGKRSISHSEFEKVWRFSGIVLRKEEME
jgi:predicted double-glycine peptidase